MVFVMESGETISKEEYARRMKEREDYDFYEDDCADYF